jgi:hypothetical protein
LEAEDRAALELIAAAGPERAHELGSAWLRHMRAGDFESAWQVSDEVLRTRRGECADALPRHFQWIWSGERLDGKRVLIRCYHGLGDTIQFIRYAPLVREVASRVIVWAQPALMPLLRTVAGIDELLPLHDGAPEVDFDVDVESMELPHVFRSTVETLPKRVPYLHVEPAGSTGNGALRVGLVWKCGDWAPERTIPVELLLPLAEIENVTLHLMQIGPAVDERPPGFGIASGHEDIMTAARTIAALDLMISIDSMPAHLAGALGVPTWTLLQANCDWRWMAAGERTPWYPTMRLFRQRSEGAWTEVVENVVAELKLLAHARSQRS